MAQHYFGYYLYSVLYTADPSGIATFGKALQNEILASLVIATLPPPSVATAMRPTTG